jgi:hypothetical protein
MILVSADTMMVPASTPGTENGEGERDAEQDATRNADGPVVHDSLRVGLSKSQYRYFSSGAAPYWRDDDSASETCGRGQNGI